MDMVVLSEVVKQHDLWAYPYNALRNQALARAATEVGRVQPVRLCNSAPLYLVAAYNWMTAEEVFGCLFISYCSITSAYLPDAAQTVEQTCISLNAPLPIFPFSSLHAC